MDVYVEERPAMLLASLRRKVPARELGDAIGEMLDAAYDALPDNPEGPPVVRYHNYGTTIDLEAGFPVLAPVEGLAATMIAGGPAAVGLHVGHYSGLAAATRAVSDWVDRNGRLNGPPMEVYLTNPATTPVEALRTEIVWPIVLDDAGSGGQSSRESRNS